jgi:hypothetical protein
MSIKFEKSILKILRGLIGGSAGGAIGAILIHFIAIYVGIPFQKANYHLISIVLWGALLGLGVAAGERFTQRGKRERLLNIICGVISVSIAGAIGGKIISGTFWGGAILGGVLGFWIILGYHLSTLFVRKKNTIKELVYLLIGGTAGGGFAGITAGLLWGFLAKGAQAEEYVLLLSAMFSMLSIMWGTGIIVGLHCFNSHVRPGTKRVN